MRYTTIIDITEWPNLYKNPAVRLVYIHLVLKSGYHDHDRDLIDISIRKLAWDTGLTVAAARHALGQLIRYHLLARQGRLWYVRKFVLEQPITGRAKTKRQEQRQEAEAAIMNERRERELKAQENERHALELRNQGKTQFMVYYEELQAKAAAGDPEAARLVIQHKQTYNAHRAAIEQEQKTN